MHIERYRDLVDDWRAFREALERPEPSVLRANTSRVAPDTLRERLERQGFTLARVSGLPGFFSVEDGPFAPSRTFEHWLGLFYVQQAVTGVAARALDPRPGERVLDLCAAPGGKTTHLSELMEERGTLVAADVNEKRIRGLLGNLYRLGHPGTLVVSADGRAFPDGVLFDRVLVDVPCSAEGNARRQGGHTTPPPSFRAHVGRVQRALLERALALTRPGGTVVYATCTFAPEENEAVLADVLAGRGDVHVKDIELTLPHAPGLTRFDDASYPPELARSWRLYPHHLDSGGLFLARLGVGSRADSGDPGGDAWPSPPAMYAEEGAREIDPSALGDGLERLTGELGVPSERLSDVRWLARGDSVWMHTLDGWPVDAWGEPSDDGWRLISCGLRAFSPGPGGRVRPTNDLLRWLGADVRERLVDLDDATCRTLLETRQLEREAPLGYVVLRLEGEVIGRAWSKGGRLRPEIPKAHAATLLDVLRTREGT